ncbi:MAG: Eco29kI family restriction endonuclease [Candidatus Paceibacterota bacterium]
MSEGNEPNPYFFRFDLDTAIRDQLIQCLEKVPKLTLGKSIGPPESGIYALYHKEELVYVGKASKETTKSGRTLRARLNEHVSKISMRQNITSDEVSVRFVTFESEWWVFAAEFVLIAYFEPAWNYSGFGSKTPGKGRPGTDRVSAWNEQFPPKEA